MVFLVPPPGESIGQHVKVGGDPLRFPQEILSDLARGHEASHVETKVISRPTVFEQEVRDGIVRFSQYLFSGPVGAPNMARYHVTKCFEVTDTKVFEVRRGRAMPEFSSREVESSQSGETTHPSTSRGVHGDVDVV